MQQIRSVPCTEQERCHQMKSSAENTFGLAVLLCCCCCSCCSCWCSCCCAASAVLLLSHSCCCDGFHALFPGKPIAWLSEPQRQRRQLALTCKSYPFKSVRSPRDDCRTLASVITENAVAIMYISSDGPCAEIRQSYNVSREIPCT